MKLIIGNIVALIVSLIMVYSGYLKQKKKILYVQTIQIGLSVLSNIILGGITGAIINAVSCIRNILCYKEKLRNITKIVLIIIAITLSLSFNNLGLIGLLPLISTIIYISLMNTQDIIKFKCLIILTMILWFVYDLYIKSYIFAGFDFMSIVVNIISIIQLLKNN